MGWLIKVVLGLALAGAVVVEVGSPVVARVQLDDVANDAADAASRTVSKDGSRARAKAVAEDIAVRRGAALTRFEMPPGGGVEVTVAKTAPSYVLKRLDQMKDWYDVEVKADSSVGSF
ncbi:MAG: hypothetical protein H0U26_03465 [Acidimicrobiia bacterium]|nr:hypothetical protein [Acidimicrobiia bacterium]